MVDDKRIALYRKFVGAGFILGGAGMGTMGWYFSTGPSLPFLRGFFLTNLFYSLNETFGLQGVERALKWNNLFLLPGGLSIVTGVLLVANFNFEGGMVKRRLSHIIFSSVGGASALVILWAITYLPQLSGVKIGGDACMYAQWIEDLTPGAMPLHWGVMALGILWTNIIPLPTDVAMNLFGILMGLGCVLLTWRMAESITGDWGAAFIAGAVLLFAPAFWYHSVLYKNYTAEMFFLLLSFYWWRKNHAAPAGLAFLLAMLISPLSVLGVSGLLLGEINRKKILRFAAASLSLYLLFHATQYPEFFFGRYGMFKQAGFVEGAPFFKMFPGSMRLLAVNFNINLVLVAPGVAYYMKKRGEESFRLFGLSAFLGFLGLVILQERWAEFASEIVFFFFISIFAGMGYLWLRRNATIEAALKGEGLQAAVAVILTTSAVVGFMRMRPQYMARSKFRDLSIEIASAMREGAALLGRWERIRLFERYGFGRLWEGRTASFDAYETEFRKSPPPIGETFASFVYSKVKSYPEVWVVETDVRDAVKAALPLAERNSSSGVAWVYLKTRGH